MGRLARGMYTGGAAVVPGGRDPNRPCKPSGPTPYKAFATKFEGRYHIRNHITFREPHIPYLRVGDPSSDEYFTRHPTSQISATHLVVGSTTSLEKYDDLMAQCVGLNSIKSIGRRTV